MTTPDLDAVVLPPLPEWMLDDGITTLADFELRDHMGSYATAAVLADRGRRAGDLSQWATARFGVFLEDGRFEELPADDPVGMKHPRGHTSRWVGGSSDMQLLRAALAASVGSARAQEDTE